MGIQYFYSGILSFLNYYRGNLQIQHFEITGVEIYTINMAAMALTERRAIVRFIIVLLILIILV